MLAVLGLAVALTPSTAGPMDMRLPDGALGILPSMIFSLSQMSTASPVCIHGCSLVNASLQPLATYSGNQQGAPPTFQCANGNHFCSPQSGGGTGGNGGNGHLFMQKKPEE